jgi:hypothetical protein
MFNHDWEPMAVILIGNSTTKPLISYINKRAGRWAGRQAGGQPWASWVAQLVLDDSDLLIKTDIIISGPLVFQSSLKI